MKVPEYSCKCSACVDMCHRTPCLGTPEEMMAIQAAGLGSRLVVIRLHGTFMLSPDSVETRDQFNYWPIEGRCKFLTRGGLCELHDAGLKPIEGRAAIHNDGEVPHPKAFMSEGRLFRLGLARSWQRPIGRALIAQFVREYELDVHY